MTPILNVGFMMIGIEISKIPIRASHRSVATDHDPSRWIAHMPVGQEPGQVDFYGAF
jgi:hypothetical protein